MKRWQRELSVEVIYPVGPTNTVKVDEAFQKKNMAGREGGKR